LALSATGVLIASGGGSVATATTTQSATGTAGVQCAYSVSEFNDSPSVNATSTSSSLNGNMRQPVRGASFRCSILAWLANPNKSENWKAPFAIG